MTQIKLRPSTPKDLEQAIPLMYSSGPDVFEYVFKNEQVNALDFLRYAFPIKGGEFAYDNHYALCQDDEIVGMGAIYSAKRASSFLLKDILKIIRFYKWKALPVLIKGLRVEQIMKPPKKNEIAIAYLGINPEHQGRGLGTQLIKLLKEQIDKNENEYYILDVSEENPRAKALYDRLGFKVTKYNTTKLKNQYSYVPNHYRMELKQD